MTASSYHHPSQDHWHSLSQTCNQQPNRVLVEGRMQDLGAQLDALVSQLDVPSRLAADPVAFAHRYSDPRDAEIAGLIAASLAYGRVSLFRVVLKRLFALLDSAGGPRSYVDGFTLARSDPLRPIVYRFNRGVDFVLLFGALHDLLAVYGGLADVFAGSTARDALTVGVSRLRSAVLSRAPAVGLQADRFTDLPRGTRYLLPSPTKGSACKRLNMYLRWMVRPTTEGIDLGLWHHVSPARLVIPVDTHVGRIARFIGLTKRNDPSWRTAVDITASLARFDPVDPVRYDFAIAHLGISGDCLGHRHPSVCLGCPLEPVCTA